METTVSSRVPRALWGRQPVPSGARISRLLPLTAVVILAQLCPRVPIGPVAAHPVVPGFARWATDGSAAGTALDGGWLLLSELNCVGCHQAPAPVPDQPRWPAGKSAPRLDRVGERVHARWLRDFLADPTATKPGTTMPNVLAGVADVDRASAHEALVHYLMGRVQQQAPPPTLPAPGSKARGEKLFHGVGCVACHNPRTPDAPQLPTSVPLGNLSAKYTLPSLAYFLRHSLQIRPAGRMPSLHLTASEAQDIAGYLLDELPERPGISYAYYEGSWDRLPDFDELTPTTTASTEKLDVAPRQRGDHFGLRFDGTLHIDAPGEYRFYLGSDDGSRLLIDQQPVINHDSVHGFTWAEGTQRLEPGLHHVRVEYFEAAGEERLEVDYAGPGIERRRLDTALVAAGDQQYKFPDHTLAIDPDLADQGRVWFHKLGCANCHGADSEDGRVEVASAPPLDKLTAEGCLSDAPEAGRPHYDLSTEQRVALHSVLAAVGTPGAWSASRLAQPGAAGELARTTLSLNCLACHARDGRGGVEAERNPYFQSTQPEMGDEGRIPPTLDGVGDKLTERWLDHILADGADDRPYMLTRMPQFGAAVAGHLRQHFASLDVRHELPPIDLPPADAKRAGWSMVGDKGFSCIKCHSFGRFAATGVQSLDMTKMTQRLREDWFRRYVRDPQQYRAGTRMPSAWPPQGKSLLPKLLAGDSDAQIAAVWRYLQDGVRARVPEGLVADTMELIPIGEAIIYRNFIEGAGARAIAVGFPEGFHVAFDANDLRLALLWQGAFLDASMHWTGRGQGFQSPLGEKVQRLPAGLAWATLQSPEASWPRGTARELPDYRFQGYSVTADQRPTFLYEVAGVSVRDEIRPDESVIPARLTRTLTLRTTKPVDNLWFLAARGPVTALGKEQYNVGESLRVTVRATNSTPRLRTVAGSQELLVPVVFDEGAATIIQYFDW